MSFDVNVVTIIRLFIRERKDARKRKDKGRRIDYLENLTTNLSEIFIDQ